MSKTKKITFNMLAAGLPKIEKQMVEYGDLQIQVTPTLPIKKVVQFVDDVVSTCVDIETGTYLPEALNFAFDCAMLNHYAGFDKPTDAEKAYRVIRETDICEVVREVVSHAQLHEIKSAIHERIKFMLDMMSSSSATNVAKLLDRMDTVMSDSQNVVETLQSVDLQKSLAEVTALYDRMDKSTELDHGEIQFENGPDKVIQIPRKID